MSPLFKSIYTHTHMYRKSLKGYRSGVSTFSSVEAQSINGVNRLWRPTVTAAQLYCCHMKAVRHDM